MTFAAELATLSQLVATLLEGLEIPYSGPNGPDPRPSATSTTTANDALPGPLVFATWEISGDDAEPTSNRRSFETTPSLVLWFWAQDGSGVARIADAMDVAVGAWSGTVVDGLWLGPPRRPDPLRGDPFPDLYGRGLEFPLRHTYEAEGE